MTLSATKAANIILETAAADGVRLTPLQVMKLVYMAHGWHLATREAPLVGESVQAWQYGPVIPTLYHSMKSFGSNKIEPPKLKTTFFDRSEPTPEQIETLKSVYRAYGAWSGPALSNLTHRPGSPWSQVWRPGMANLVIPNDLIMGHYKKAKRDNVLVAA